MMFKMNKAVTVDESTFQSRAIPATDADAIRADVLAYNERPKDAQALIDAVLRDDPKNAIAHETMGTITPPCPWALPPKDMTRKLNPACAPA
jgi:hypothetical protein